MDSFIAEAVRNQELVDVAGQKRMEREAKGGKEIPDGVESCGYYSPRWFLSGIGGWFMVEDERGCWCALVKRPCGESVVSLFASRGKQVALAGELEYGNKEEAAVAAQAFVLYAEDVMRHGEGTKEWNAYLEELFADA